MKYTTDLNEQQVEILKSIFEQLEPRQLIVAPAPKVKKLSKTEQIIQSRREYRASKAARKRN